jgi:ribose/xylose/arabinose/galactoside ABC-type transport system permease subunit
MVVRCGCHDYDSGITKYLIKPIRGSEMNSGLSSIVSKKENSVLALIIRYPILPTLAFFILMAITFIIISPVGRNGNNIFLSPHNLANIVEATAGFSIGAFTMTLVLLVGCIDLSTGGIIALSSVVLGVCLSVLEINFLVSLLITFSVGVICGIINATLVIKCKVESFLATIAVDFVFTGLAYTISESRSILITTPALVRLFGSIGSGASFFGLPMQLWWTLICLVGMYLLISKSKFGRWAQATGGNKQAAYSSGVNTALVQTAAFILMGVFSSLIGIILCARLSTASPGFGVGYGLKFIIAAVLGGTNFTGDGGSVWGALLGSLVMGVLTNGLGIIGVSIYIQQVVTGIVIVGAVVFSIYISSRK